MLHIQDLVVELDTEAGLLRALDGLRLSIERGETFALVGESGCGKSMSALALMRLLPENGQVVAGQVRLGEASNGRDLLDLPEQAMRAIRGRRIGMIFQEPSTSLNPVMRVGEQIVEAIETHTPLRGEAAHTRAIEWLRRVGISDPERRFDDYPFRMSGGQKQRVMIAIALAGEPDLLIADEPTTALDVTIQAQILDLLKDLQREHRMGLLLITHDLAVVKGLAHRVALMYAGQLVEVATAEAFFRQPRHPYAQALLRAMPGGAQRGRELAAIPGTVPALTQAFTGCRYAPRCALAQSRCHAEAPALEAVDERAVRCWLAWTPEAARPVVPAPAPATLPSALSSPPGSAAGGASGAFGASDPARRANAAAPVPLLQVDGLRVRYPVRGGWLQRQRGHFDAVAGIGFTLEAGETLALVGESGCGKTTTGKAIVQLLRQQPAEVSGRVLLDGQDLLTLRGAALLAARRQVQLVFQDPFASLNPRLRVGAILEEGLLALRTDLDGAARQRRLRELVDQVGLRPDALQRYPHEFSGGQRQRIAIARALAVSPRLLVCDEPTSALDVSVQAQILNLLMQLQRDLGLSYLFITHNLAVVEQIAHRVAVMQAGRIVESGPAEVVLGAPQQPYTQGLLAAVPRL